MAAHAPAEAHAPETKRTEGSLAALAGTGASVALQVPPDKVSMRLWPMLVVVSYSPTAVHAPAEAHATESRPATRPVTAAFAGSGASVGIHRPPDRVSMRPWVLPNVSS